MSKDPTIKRKCQKIQKLKENAQWSNDSRNMFKNPKIKRNRKSENKNQIPTGPKSEIQKPQKSKTPKNLSNNPTQTFQWKQDFTQPKVFQRIFYINRLLAPQKKNATDRHLFATTIFAAPERPSYNQQAQSQGGYGPTQSFQPAPAPQQPAPADDDEEDGGRYYGR